MSNVALLIYKGKVHRFVDDRDHLTCDRCSLSEDCDDLFYRCKDEGRFELVSLL